MHVRHPAPDDHPRLVAAVDDWWGGRTMTGLLPRPFVERFRSTSFVVEGDDGELLAFLIGFPSDTDPDDAYVHVVGVAPGARGTGLGRALHERFAAAAARRGATTVTCVTSPENTGSIAFHRALGFESRTVERYDGRGGARVVFERALPPVGDPRVPRSEIAGLARAHRDLVAWLTTTDWDPGAPSLLPGWNVGHVLTHLARNGDSVSALLEAAHRGEVGAQYPGGAEQRATDIDRGATRSAEDLLADVARSAATVDHLMATTPDDVWLAGRSTSLGGEIDLRDWPWRRWREVEVHLADVGGAFGYDDWSGGYVRREWTEQLAALPQRLPAGVGVRVVATDHDDEVVGVGRPEIVTVSGRRRDLLAWMLGRPLRDGAVTGAVALAPG